MIVKVTSSNFDEVVNSNKKVVIDFFANWCMPCKALGEEFHKFENVEGLTIGKVDCDEEYDLCEKFRVSSIPAVFIFEDGKLVNSFVGYRSEKELGEILK